MRSNAESTVERRYRKVRQEVEEASRAVDENTVRLRALRLAREKQVRAGKSRRTT